MSGFEEFKRNLETVSGKFAAIAQKTLQQNVKLAKHGINGAHVKPPFCSYPGACEDKRLRMVYYARGKKRRYQLCRAREGCNQRTLAPTYYEVP